MTRRPMASLENLPVKGRATLPEPMEEAPPPPPPAPLPSPAPRAARPPKPPEPEPPPPAPSPGPAVMAGHFTTTIRFPVALQAKFAALKYETRTPMNVCVVEAVEEWFKKRGR